MEYDYIVWISSNEGLCILKLYRDEAINLLNLDKTAREVKSEKAGNQFAALLQARLQK